ncbi:hypothetical protein [Hydrogenophaga sp.]|uniref:hypothetical protein n=1 Tax=Hydrogenophaga sp. TaxID=1904254 RepID=UPI0027333347|nr:hypothetical protein [Hydrogenophaga sp.]MDP3885489.1 hypothetical protein [Hydrogenophaga sp.]
MSTNTRPTGDLKSAAPRRAGRRPKLGSKEVPPGISKDEIVHRAALLAQEEPFSEITIARLGRELGVAPALIHYFIGSRDNLLSLVINQALMERAETFPDFTDDWRFDLEALLRHTIEMQMRWKGITTYIASHNKYRLFQRVEQGEEDFGLVFFDRMGRILRASGLTPQKSAMAFHLLMLFTTAVANASVNRQEPALHKEYILGHLAKFPPTRYPGASFIGKAFTTIDSKKTIDQGIGLLIDSIEHIGAAPKRKAAAVRPTVRGKGSERL